MNPSITAGHLVIAMIAALENQGIPSVYLRNYENLPTEVGNDVDLLVPKGKRAAAAAIMLETHDPSAPDHRLHRPPGASDILTGPSTSGPESGPLLQAIAS